MGAIDDLLQGSTASASPATSTQPQIDMRLGGGADAGFFTQPKLTAQDEAVRKKRMTQIGRSLSAMYSPTSPTGPVAGALVRDIQENPFSLLSGQLGTHMRDLGSDVVHRIAADHTPGGIVRAIEAQPNLVDPKTLQPIKAAGGPFGAVAGYALDHPRQTGFATAGLELANPLGWIGGGDVLNAARAVGNVGRRAAGATAEAAARGAERAGVPAAAGAIRKTAEAVGRVPGPFALAAKAGKTAAAPFDRYAPVRDSAGQRGEDLAHTMESQLQGPEHRTVDAVVKAFGDPSSMNWSTPRATARSLNPARGVHGLTSDEQGYVANLSYEHPAGSPWTPFERDPDMETRIAAKGGGTAEERARGVRAYMRDADARAVQRGIMDPNDPTKPYAQSLMDSGTFFPMKEYRDRAVFADDYKTRNPGAAATGVVPLSEISAPRSIAPRAGFAVSRRMYSGHKGSPPNYLLPPGALSPDFLPAHQILEHYSMVERAIAQADALKLAENTKLPVGVNGAEIPARARVEYFKDFPGGRMIANPTNAGPRGGKPLTSRERAMQLVEEKRKNAAQQQAATEAGRPDLLKPSSPFSSALYLRGLGRGRVRGVQDLNDVQKAVEQAGTAFEGKPLGQPMYRYQSTMGGANANVPAVINPELEQLFGKLPKRETETTPEYSPLRRGTFFALGTPEKSGIGNFYAKKNPGKGEGGSVQVKSYYAPDNPLKVELTPGVPRTLGPNVLVKLLPESEAVRLIRMPMTAPRPQVIAELEKHGVSHVDAVEISQRSPYLFWDRIAGELARRAGYDAMEVSGGLDVAGAKGGTEMMLLYPYAVKRGPSPIEGVASDLEAAGKKQALAGETLRDAIKRSGALRAALGSKVGETKAAGREAMQALTEAQSVVKNQFHATGNAGVDAHAFEWAQHRGTNPSYMERRLNLEDAAGNVTGSVRTSGNANRAKGYETALFTPGDVRSMRKFAGENGVQLSVKQADDLLHQAHAFMLDRERMLAQLVDQHGSGPDAIRNLTNALRESVGSFEGAQGRQAGAQSFHDLYAGPAHAAADAAESTAGQMGDFARRLRTAQTGGVTAIKRAGDKIGETSDRVVAELSDLADRLLTARADEKTRDQIKSRTDALLKQWANRRSLADEVDEEWAKAPAGYTRERDLQLGARDSNEFALQGDTDRPGVAQLLGEPTADARGKHQGEEVAKLGRVVSTLNNLARTSVILLPQVHVLGNLAANTWATFHRDPRIFPEILGVLRGKIRPTEEQIDLMRRSGALPGHMGNMQGLYGHGEAEALTRHYSELKPLQAADQYVSTKYWAPNQRLVFGWFEEGMAWINFRRFLQDAARKEGPKTTEQRMAESANTGYEVTPATMRAGRETRKTLGDYRNVSGSERRWGLNRLMFFYPFLKTAIGVWTKHGLLQPNATVNAPVRGIEANNQIEGYDDPTEPFTATVGRDQWGSPRRYTPPYAGRITENLGRTMMLPYDAGKGLLTGDWGEFKGDVKAPFSMIANRLNPGARALATGLATGMGASVPGYNEDIVPPDSPLNRGIDMLNAGAQQTIGPVGHAEDIARDPVGGALSTGIGGFTYAQPVNLTRKQLHEAQQQYYALRKAGFDDAAEALRQRIAAAQTIAP